MFQISSHKAKHEDADNVAAQSTHRPKYWEGEYDLRTEKRASVGVTDAEDDSISLITGSEIAVAGVEEERQVPKMSVAMTIGLLCVVTVVNDSLIVSTCAKLTSSALQFVAITAVWLINSIDSLTKTGTISKDFAGIVLAPFSSVLAG